MTSGFPQGSVWGAVWFNISVNDVDSGLQCILSNFVHVTKLCGTVDTVEGMPRRGILTVLKGEFKPHEVQ